MTTRPLALAAMLLAAASAAADPAPKKLGPDPKAWAEAVQKGRAFLTARQADDGSFSKATPGITAIDVIALARTGDKADPAVRKALKVIEGHIDEADGHLARGPSPA